MKTEAQYHMDRLMMWGGEALGAYVRKSGRSGWVVEIGGVATPVVYRTKTEALRHAEARIYAMNERWAWEPYLYTAAIRPGPYRRPANID